jgi:hypothetical protein
VRLPRAIGLRRPAKSSQRIDGAFDPSTAAVEDVCVDHGRREVAVAQQLLDRPDVVAALEQVGREGMTVMPGPTLPPLCQIPDYAGFRVSSAPHLALSLSSSA